jgi:cytochrome oxidase Cu insertion factor (SCO1/SenC/PrrC family)
MKTKNLLLSSILSTAFLITACGGTPTADAMMDKGTPTAEAMMEKETSTEDAMMPHETPTGDAMMTEEMLAEDAMMESPTWYAASLTDARTGQVFVIQDLKGKVILVETMAVWCSNCLKQQGQVKALHELLGERDDFVSVGLDIDPNEDAGSLKTYVESNGFDWLYAVPPVDVSREIASLYGDQFLNPPSTPILVIDRKGEAHPLPFGIKSADELLQYVQPYLDEAM